MTTTCSHTEWGAIATQLGKNYKLIATDQQSTKVILGGTNKDGFFRASLINKFHENQAYPICPNWFMRTVESTYSDEPAQVALIVRRAVLQFREVRTVRDAMLGFFATQVYPVYATELQVRYGTHAHAAIEMLRRENWLDIKNGGYCLMRDRHPMSVKKRGAA